METFSALLALCAGNSPVIGEFPTQRPVTRSFGVFFDLRLHIWLSRPSWGWWFEKPSCSLWRHCNAIILIKQYIAGWYPDYWITRGQSRLTPTRMFVLTQTFVERLVGFENYFPWMFGISVIFTCCLKRCQQHTTPCVGDLSLTPVNSPPLNKIAATSQTIFSNTFSWMKSFVFWLKFHRSLSLRVQWTITQHWFR